MLSLHDLTVRPPRGILKPVNEEKFWARVDKSAGPNACWPWRGPLRHGYGAIHFMKRTHRAHRVAFYLEHGHWPEPCCCHICDVPRCCNPRHLWEGTQADNMNDMRAKGRGPAKKPVRPKTALQQRINARSVRNLARFGVARIPCRPARWNVFC